MDGGMEEFKSVYLRPTQQQNNPEVQKSHQRSRGTKKTAHTLTHTHSGSKHSRWGNLAFQNNFAEDCMLHLCCPSQSFGLFALGKCLQSTKTKCSSLMNLCS